MIRECVLLVTSLSLGLMSLPAPAQAPDTAARKQAEAIFAATGVTGGLIVHLGCGDGHLTAALKKDSVSLVHGLDADTTTVNRARTYIRSLGIYGQVAVEHWDSAFLPYVDNTINLLVVEAPGAIPPAEMTRALVPHGVAYVKKGATWAKVVKPARAGVDDWTHFQYDASGNSVSGDTTMGPPRHLQWTAEPRHTRSHEFTPSIQAVVSATGRIFYIADKAPTATLRKPAEWALVSRDAYNGLLLWERAIPEWFSHLCGWTSGPRQLQHKLVAVGDRVYVTLGFHDQVQALDAATGETVMTYTDTHGADEILYHNGILLLAIRTVTDERLTEYRKWADLTAQTESPLHIRDTAKPLVQAFRQAENKAPRMIIALNAATGQTLWKKVGGASAGLRPLSLRACGDKVYCQKDGGLHCFDLKTGAALWAKPTTPLRTVSEDAVVCLSKTEIMVLSPEDGSVRWKQPPSLLNIRDVFLINGALWIGGFKPFSTGNKKYTGPVWGPFFAAQHNLKTGALVKEISQENPKHHHRCWDNKATERYILGGRRGTEFLDLETGDVLWHSWARGVCRYGIMPANGMLYVPPHSCGCYRTVQLEGFNALAPARARTNAERADKDRLERGPAYGRQTAADADDDWPTYRGDAQRSGRTRGTIPTALTTKWQTPAGRTTTAPVVAGGKMLVACADRHELIAVDTRTGHTAWTFTGGGRIDSPPTVYQGQVIIGCSDGFVYSLQAEDGALSWRFRGARDPLRVIVRGQVESASPIHGSVLIDGDTLCFTAGRSSYLDGGIDLYRLNPRTGETLSCTTIHSPDEDTGQQPKQYGPNTMPGARSDLLAADSKHIYLRDLTFSKQGVEIKERASHLFTLTDFLDDSWTHRSYWILGTKSSLSTGCSGRDRKLLYGRLLSFDETTAYGYGREKIHWSNEFEDGEYRVFARKLDTDKPTWAKPVPVHVQAMLLAGDVIFAAGAGAPPERIGRKDERRAPPLLLVISTADGTELARYPIPAEPVFNGMAAANGELFLTLKNGQLLCMTGN